MFSPETIVIYKPPLVVTRHDGADYYGPVPWCVRLNPLRYQITLFPGPRRWTINRDGRWYLRWSNFTFALRGKAAKEKAMADIIIIASQDDKNTLLPYTHAEAMYNAVVYHRRWWRRLSPWRIALRRRPNRATKPEAHGND